MDGFAGKMLDKMTTLWSKTNRWHRGFLLFFLVEMRWIPGGQVGFRCNDPALSHPFTGDTISWKLLLVTVVLLPLVVMLLIERKYHRDQTEKPKKQALRWYKEYLFGVLINLVTVQTLKQLVGSPRPHFFDTCSPEEATSCIESEYVPYYTCTKAHWLSQSDRSFPSGHTSLALHSGLFLAYYLHRRTKEFRNPTVIVFQILFIVSAVYCGISRILDHRHHWWDVLAGAVISAPILIYTIQSLCRNFDCATVEEIPTSNGDNVQIVDTKLT